MIKVIGLQRSGTNYLTELLKLNFEDHVYSNPLEPFFKHSFTYETLVTLKNKIHLQKEPYKIQCYKIVIKKTLKQWLRSINRNPADLYQKRPYLKNNDVLPGLYDAFYNSWSNEFTVNYKDLLLNLQAELTRIQKHFNLTPKKTPFLDIKKVPHSKPFTPEKRKEYL